MCREFTRRRGSSERGALGCTHGLLSGKTLGVDSATLEANAATTARGIGSIWRRWLLSRALRFRRARTSRN